MGSACCKKTKIVDAAIAVVQIQNVAKTEIPYGYVFIYPGIPTSHETYTCPMLSIHTYHHSSRKTNTGYAEAQFSNKKKYRKLGPTSTLNEERLTSDETVIMIPVEDVISIHYTSDVEKSVKAAEHSRLVPVVKKKGFCSCFRKTPEPQLETTIDEEKNAERVITIHMQYSKHSNLDTLSNARILSEAERMQFFKEMFHPKEQLKFYLVKNTEYDSTSFEQKRAQAENLCRVLMQLKGMNSGVSSNNLRIRTEDGKAVPAAAVISYPSPEELQELLQPPRSVAFGDPHQEASHSLRTQLDFGTYVPVPIQTAIIGTVEKRPKDVPVPIQTKTIRTAKVRSKDVPITDIAYEF